MNQIKVQYPPTPRLRRTSKKILKDLPWERDVKSWDWDNLIPEKFSKLSLDEFKNNIAFSHNNSRGRIYPSRISGFPSITIDNLENCSQAIQNKIYKNLIKQIKFAKIDLLQRSQSRTDIVINIPANANITIDFINIIFANWANLYFVIGSNSQVTILDKHDVNKNKFGAGSVMTIIGKNAVVNYGIDTNDRANYHFNYKFVCAENSQARVFVLNNIQTKHHFHSISIDHYNRTSHGEITWLVDAQTNTNSVFFLANNHYSQNTTADMVIKALGRAKSQVKIDGWINIGKRGRQTDSYLQEDVLLVSENSNIKAEPNLEILNNDVRASHGATLGMVSQQQLLYLQSRGLSKAEAENIITTGFMKAGLERLQDEFLLKYFSSKFD